MTYTITQLTTGNSLLAVRNDYQISSNNSALWVENGALKFYNGQNTRILESSGFFDPQASNGKAVWYKIVQKPVPGFSFSAASINAFLFDGNTTIDLGEILTTSGNGPSIAIDGDRVAFATNEGVTVHNTKTGSRSVIPGSPAGKSAGGQTKVAGIALDPVSDAVIWHELKTTKEVLGYTIGLYDGLKMYDGSQIVDIASTNTGGGTAPVKAEIYDRRVIFEGSGTISLYDRGDTKTVASNLKVRVDAYGGSFGLNDTTVFFEDGELKNYDIATGTTAVVAETSVASTSYGNGRYRAWQDGNNLILSDGSTQTNIATSNSNFTLFDPAVGADGSVLYINGGNLYLATTGSTPPPSTNQAPTVTNAIANQTATVGTAFSVVAPTNEFSDPENDTLTYSASQSNNLPLPVWLSFDPVTRTFSGTPGTGNEGTLELQIRATDPANNNVSDIFNLTVSSTGGTTGGGGGGGGTGGTGGTGGGSTIVPGLSLTSNLFQTDSTFKGFGISPISQKPTQKVSEIALFAVDDLSGTIGGIAPGAAGYLAAALNNAKSIFSTLGGSFFSTDKRELALDPNKIYQALEIVDGSILDARQQLAGGKIPNNLLFSFPDGSGNSPIKITNTANGFNLSINNDELVLAIDKLAGAIVNTPIGAKSQSSPEGRTIDLTDYAGQTLKADIFTKSSAAYQNQVGFYAVEDASGTIKLANGSTLKPGDANYAVEAIKLALNNSLQAGKTDTQTGKDIIGGQIYAPVVVAQGTFNDFVTKNPTNGGGADAIHAYFNYLGANSDKVDHFRLLGNNTFGVEDMYGGGDRDFNDLVVKLDIKV
jgi:hypothetical protein